MREILRRDLLGDLQGRVEIADRAEPIGAAVGHHIGPFAFRPQPARDPLDQLSAIVLDAGDLVRCAVEPIEQEIAGRSVVRIHPGHPVRDHGEVAREACFRRGGRDLPHRIRLHDAGGDQNIRTGLLGSGDQEFERPDFVAALPEPRRVVALHEQGGAAELRGDALQGFDGGREMAEREPVMAGDDLL